MSKNKTTIFLALVGLMSLPVLVFSQISDTFQINQVITGVDTTPPTVPAALTALPISISQINLSWNASTDNVAVAGYQVFRDGSFIATSTLTNYSDTGLSASTLYAYTIKAFDAALNFSTSSATATATTLSGAGADSGDGTSSGRRVELQINDVQVLPKEFSASVFWRTSISAKSVVAWGQTPDYELGRLSEVSPNVNHTAKLDGLLPGTRYYIEILALDRFGRVGDRFNGSFITVFAPDTSSPSTVVGFTARGLEDSIKLSWVLPQDTDFDSVRIVRSDKFFPEDYLAGALVYEGKGVETTDTKVTPGVLYYYSAFTKDLSGNYSAPAVASAVVGRTIDEPLEEFPDAPDVPLGIQQINILDFDFSQEGERISYLGGTVSVRGDKPLTVSIDYDKLPEVLKTIGVTLVSPSDESGVFTFLLRIDKEKTRYEATIAPLEDPGSYPMTATILDFKNQKLTTVKGALLVLAGSEISQQRAGGETLLQSLTTIIVLLLLTLILVLLILFRGWKN